MPDTAVTMVPTRTGSKAEFKFWESKEIIIALISLSGVLIVGALSNFDKIFPNHGKVTAEYSGYQPTGNFETELRYYLDISGDRKSSQVMTDNIVEDYKTAWIKQYPSINKNHLFDKIGEIIQKKMPTYDDSINLILSTYQKYFTVSQLQELNKFYSTRPMRDMVEKMPLLQKELGPIMAEFSVKFQSKINKEIMEIEKSEESQKEDNNQPPK